MFPEAMKIARRVESLQAYRWAAGLVVVSSLALLISSIPSDAAPASAAALERSPLLLSGLDTKKLTGDTICIYNFSSW